MALANRASFIVTRQRRTVFYAITLRITPASDKLTVEIQRTTDSAGAPNVGAAVSLGEVGPFPIQGTTFLDLRANDGSIWWYRCRHTGVGNDPGNWTTWLSSTPRRLSDATVDATGRATHESLYIRTGVKGASDVAFGSTLKFSTNRHNETLSGTDTQSPTFSASYEQVPEIRILPQTIRTPAAGDTIVLKALSPTIAGCTIKAVSVAGLTVTARSDDMAATLNGTPVGAGITIGAPGSVAYTNLSNANTTATTYKVYYDVNTTGKSGGGIMRVTAYRNDGVSSTVWTQVGQKTYDDGENLTGEHIDFSAALAQNWDVRVVVTYTGTPSVNGVVVADRVDYDQITGGTETALTNVTGGAVLVQAVEPS